MMDINAMTDGEVAVRLALLKDAAKDGEGGVLRALAAMNGQATVKLYEDYDYCGRKVSENAGPVTVVVDRVRGMGPDYRGGTVLAFDGLPDWHKNARLVVREEPHKVRDLLRRHGWKYADDLPEHAPE